MEENVELELKNISKYYPNDNIKILGYINNVPEMLNIADLIITKPGGATVTECLYFDVPMLFIGKISGQEKANARYLEKNKCANVCDNVNIMFKNIDKLLGNDKRLEKYKNNINKIKKNNSMEKLFELINDLLGVD